MSFSQIQKLYAIIGPSFMPLLAIGLLILNGQKKWMGDHRNHLPALAGLVFTLAFFAWIAWEKWVS